MNQKGPIKRKQSVDIDEILNEESSDDNQDSDQSPFKRRKRMHLKDKHNLEEGMKTFSNIIDFKCASYRV